MSFSVIILALVSINNLESGTTAQIKEVNPWNMVELDTYTAGTEKSINYVSVTSPQKAKERSFKLLLPPKSVYVLRCDPQKFSVSDTLVPNYGLTSKAKKAVNAAPDWVQPDLVDNLKRMNKSKQDELADLILNPVDENLRDEIAFQIAHITPNQLRAIQSSLIARNVDSLDAIAKELKYVDIVNYGDPKSGGNYYSTVRYKARDGEKYFEFELPKEIYYWYIIHPRGTDEVPKIVYGKSWREFLYYNNGTASYTDNVGGDPYPLLRDELADSTYLWDFSKKHIWKTGALGAVHHWVGKIMHWGAKPPRPIQPNEIAVDHNGNCGEYQDITWAACRTAFIPAAGVLDLNEDHVWVAYWRPYDYNSSQEGYWYGDSAGAYDKDRRGGNKYCSLIWQWRGDGYQYSEIGTYSKCCTLTVTVYDPDGNPLPNAEVKLLSEGWKTSQLVKGFSGVTNRDGIFQTTIGEEQNYTASAYLQSMGKIIDSAEALAGTHFQIPCTLSVNYKPSPNKISAVDETPQPLEKTYLNLDVNAEYEIAYCGTYTFEESHSVASVKTKPGKLTNCFVTNHQGLVDFLAEKSFKTYANFPINGEEKHNINYPINEPCYVIFFNNYGELSEVISGKVSVDDHSAIATNPEPYKEPISLQIADQNSNKVSFYINASRGPIEFSVFDVSGSKVFSRSIQSGISKGALIEWQTGSCSSGVYFAQVASDSDEAIAKFVVVK